MSRRMGGALEISSCFKDPLLGFLQYLKNIKEQGSQGFKDVKLFNLSLILKQALKVDTCSDSLLFKIYRGKYFRNSPFLDVDLGSRPSWGQRSIWDARKLLKEGIMISQKEQLY